jgi:hypothetical protein
MPGAAADQPRLTFKRHRQGSQSGKFTTWFRDVSVGEKQLDPGNMPEPDTDILNCFPILKFLNKGPVL